MDSKKFIETIGDLINGRYDAYDECYREEHDTIPMEHFLDSTMNRIKRDIKRLSYLQSHTYTNVNIDDKVAKKLLPPYYDSRSIQGRKSGFKKSNYTKLLKLVKKPVDYNNGGKDNHIIFTIDDMKKIYDIYLLNKRDIDNHKINIHDTINKVVKACESKYTLFKISNLDWKLAKRYIKSLYRTPDNENIFLYLITLKGQQPSIKALDSPYNLEPENSKQMLKEHKERWGSLDTL